MKASEFFFSPENKAVTYKLIRFSLWMLLFPLSVFFSMHYLVFGGDRDRMQYCGLGAIIACNLVIAAYVYMAFTEDYASNFQSKDSRNPHKGLTLYWLDRNLFKNPLLSAYVVSDRSSPVPIRSSKRISRKYTTD